MTEPSYPNRYRRTLLSMRNLSPLALFAILMVTSLSPLAFGPTLEHNPPREVSPRALIDFEVSDIELGNGSLQAREGKTPDGSIVKYVMRDELIQINVTFTQAGTSGNRLGNWKNANLAPCWSNGSRMVSEHDSTREPNHSELNFIGPHCCSELPRR
ncbi:MAG: hypothetical protein Ct9H90mP14_2350 [Methanobacteriota archaeon]|nr:MAG: hypothetical protein Ct9H90mP14_2350 [Euryarchaeota archaeon]